MKIISLSSKKAGYACAVASSVKKYFYGDSKITDLFDYLEISFKSINQFLSLKEDDLKHIDFDKETLNKHENGYSIKFKNFHEIYSHHDLLFTEENDYVNLREKYIRRYKRMIEMIKNEDKIFFLRFGSEKEEEIKIFYDVIKTLNQNLQIYFINLFYSEEEDEDIYLDEYPNYYKIYFEKMNEKKEYSEDPYYKITESNWLPVYELIKNNLDKNESIRYYFYD